MSAAVTVTMPASAAERKREQRRRDRAALLDTEVALAESLRSMTAGGLVELLQRVAGRPELLALVLVELGRRGGLQITATPTTTIATS